MITHERVSRLLVGLAILGSITLGQFVTPYGYLIAVATALNLIKFFFTGRCCVKDMLDRLGVPYETESEGIR